MHKQLLFTVFLVSTVIAGSMLTGFQVAKGQSSTGSPQTVNSAQSTSRGWNYSESTPFWSEGLGGGYLFIAEDDNIKAINENNGQVAWTLNTNSRVAQEPSTCYSNGVLYAGDNTGDLYAINASTGQQIWIQQIKSQSSLTYLHSMVVASGRVYVDISGYDINVEGLYCFDAHSGAELWSFSTKSSTNFDSITNPLVTGNLVYVSSCDDDNNAVTYALNASTGEQIWNFSTTWNFGASYPMFPLVEGSTVCVALKPNSQNPIKGLATGEVVYGLDAETGVEKWQFTATGVLDPWFVSANGRIYVTYEGNTATVYAIDASNGKALWNYTAQSSLAYSPIISENTIYLPTGSGGYKDNFYALDASSGTQLWMQPAGAASEQSPFQAYSDWYPAPVPYYFTVGNGAVYMNTYSGSLLVLDGLTGSTSFSQQSPGFGPIIAGQMLYIFHTNYADGNYYAPNSVSSIIYAISENSTSTQPTPSPNANNSTSPTTTSPTVSSTPSPSQTVPELSYSVVLPLLLSIFSVAILLRHRKTSNFK